jgi:hypothetical protein
MVEFPHASDQEFQIVFVVLEEKSLLQVLIFVVPIAFRIAWL